jgi:myo-inositol-1(or 4)-monophosphatase
LRALETEPEARDDLARAIDAVRRAGEVALRRFGRRVKNWRKGDGTPVSEADLEVDEVLRRSLSERGTAYGWHSEESQAGSPLQQRFWLVDPIDGTSAFLGGSSAWCISLALIDNHRPTLGLIYAPAQERLYAAASGGGARLNGQPLSVSERQELAGARLIANVTALKAQRWQETLPETQRVSVPSLALRLAHVAEGKAEAALAFSYKHDWDLAAGDLIATEAGGKMSDLDGEGLRYDFAHTRRLGFICANPFIHSALLAHGPIAAEQ